MGSVQDVRQQPGSSFFFKIHVTIRNPKRSNGAPDRSQHEAGKTDANGDFTEKSSKRTLKPAADPLAGGGSGVPAAASRTRGAGVSAAAL
jgi:hypothetical protein